MNENQVPVSFSPVSFHLGTLFLALEVLFLLNFYLKRNGSGGRYLPINPVYFLTFCFLFAVLGALFSALMSFSHISFAFVLSAGVLTSILHPLLAVCFLVSNLVLRIWEMTVQTNALLDALPRGLAMLTLCSWVLYCIAHKEFKIVWNQACTIYVFLVSWITLSAMFSGDMEAGLNDLMVNFFPATVVSLLVLNAPKKSNDLEAMRGTLVISIVGLIAGAYYYTINHPLYAAKGLRLQLPSLLGNSNDLAALIVLVVPFVILPLVRGKREYRRWQFAGISLAILMLGLWSSQSRGALTALGISGLVYVIACRRMAWNGILILAVTLMIPAVLFSSLGRSEADLEGSSVSRWNYARTGLNMAIRNPIFGVGIGNYPKLYENYTSLFVEWGKRTAHSSWVLVMAEAGFVGLGLFAMLFYMAARRAWRIRDKLPEYFLAIVAYGIAMSFLSHTYLFVPYLLFAYVFAAERLQRLSSTAILALIVGIFASGADTRAEELLAAKGTNKPLGAFEPDLQRKLSLKGSRGETLNFMLKVGSAGCQSFRPPIFQDTNNHSTEFPMKFYVMETITSTQPSFPNAYVGPLFDPLIPLKQELCVANGTSKWIFGELAIPLSASPGKYEGSISFGNLDPVSVYLTVWKMQMPAEHALPGYAEFSPWYGLKGHYGEWHPGEESLAEKYTLEMAEHRLFSTMSIVANPPVEQRNGRWILDLFNSPSPSASFFSVNLKHRPAWAMFGFPTVSPNDIEKEQVRNYFKGVQNSIELTKRPGKAMVYLWDEPRKEDFPHLMRFARLVKSLAPSLKVMVTVNPQPMLNPYIDIFVPVADHFAQDGFPALKDYHQLQREGKQIWWYVSCMSHGCGALMDSGTPDMVIDRPSVYIRSIAWLGMLQKLDAFFYYSVVDAYSKYPSRDPWDSLWDFSGNGDGTLFYPGRPGQRGFEQHEPVVSLRLKAWREASFDAEYINWMNQNKRIPSWWSADFHKLVTNTKQWDREYQNYQDLRDRVGEFLDRE